MTINRKHIDSIIEQTKKFWETGDTTYMRKKLNIAEKLADETGLSWVAWADFISSVFCSKGIRPDATNELIYSVLEGFGYELV